MTAGTHDRFFKKDFWAVENRRYAEPHLRLRRCARIVNALAGQRDCDLLDLGCGPAALAQLLRGNIRYFGIDIALQVAASNLREADFIENEICWDGTRFDILLASGVFEYVGAAQDAKLREISRALKDDGHFIVSYINFDHIHRVISPLYNNIRSIPAFKAGLEEVFEVERCFPVSYNWHGTPPRRRWLQAIQSRLDRELPFIGRSLAVEYLFVCATRQAR
jgi:SAM-dependent methyltransferase